MSPLASETDKVIHVEVAGQPGKITELNAAGLPIVRENEAVLGRVLLPGELVVIKMPPPQKTSQ